MAKRILLLLISSVLLCSCRDIVYSEYQPVPVSGWHKDSALTYNFEIQDTLSTYEMVINVRHTDRYPNQNMWLFVDGDTIEFYLADDRGQWLGNGRNGLSDMPVLYEEAMRFEHSGMHTLTIRHGMRYEELCGVSDVGLTITRNGKE